MKKKINEFILFYWKKNIIYFLWSSSRWKNMKKKTKKTEVQEAGMGYCPFSQFESRYNFCIVTQCSWARSRGATPRHGRLAATLPHDTARMGHDTAGRAQGRAAARARDLISGVCHDTIVFIGTKGRPGRWVSRDTMLRHGRACTTIRPGGAQHGQGGCDTTRSRAHWSATRPTTRPVHAATQSRGRQRYGQRRPTTRRLVRHDTAGPARNLGHGCVHTVHLTQS